MGRNRHIKGFGCIFLSIIWVWTTAGGQHLRRFDTKVELRTEKTSVITRQPIWVNIRIQNGTRPGPKIDGRALEKHFIIREKNGLILNPASEGSESGIYPMEPGSLLEARINIITPYYRLGKRDPYLVPGDYTVVFVWEEPGYEPIRSDAVNIRVMDPKGREGHALRLLNEGDTDYRLGRIHKSDANYERLVQRYPESVYAAPALELIFRNHQDGMDRVHQSRRLDSAIKLINDYADCDFNMVRMCFEIEDAVERGIVPDTFEDVLIRWTRHSNERVRRFANRVLKKWENRIE